MNTRHLTHAGFESLVFTPTGGDSADLDDVLRATVPLVQRDPNVRVWSVYSLWAVGKPGTDVNVLQLEHDVNNAANGLQLTLHEIERLLDSLRQVVDVIIIAAASNAELPERTALNANAAKYQTKIELIDSTSVVVSTRSRVVAAALIAELGFTGG